jgi:hypothetical protein
MSRRNVKSKQRSSSSGVVTVVDPERSTVTSIIEPRNEQETLITSVETDHRVVESDVISTSIIAVPSKNERIVAIDKVPLHVEHKGGTRKTLNFELRDGTVRKESASSFKPVRLVVDTESGIVTTDDATAKLITLNREGKELNITLTDPVIVPSTVRKSRNWKEKIKTTIITALLAALLSMTGKPSERCIVHNVPENTPFTHLSSISTAPIPQPHHFFLPELEPLGVATPMAVANTVILDRTNDDIAGGLTHSALTTVQATREAFEMGSVVENVRNNHLIDGLQREIATLRRDFKSSQRELLHTQKNFNNLQEDLSESTDRINELLGEIVHLEQIAEQDAFNTAYQRYNEHQWRLKTSRLHIKAMEDLEKTVSEKNEMIQELRSHTNETLQQLAKIMAMKTQLEIQVIQLDSLNAADKETIDDLKQEVSRQRGIIESLNANVDHLRSYHSLEMERAVQQRNRISQESFERGKSEGLETVAQVRQWELEKHQKELQAIQIEQGKLHDEYYKKGKKEVSEAMTATIATMQQKLRLAQTSVDQFRDWAAPKVRVLHFPNGSYEVSYNIDHISKVAPLMKDYIVTIAKEFEAELNGNAKFETKPKPIVDLKLTQRIITDGLVQRMVGNIKDFFGFSQTRETGRFQMVLIGTTNASDESLPIHYEYVPVNIQDLAPYKEALEKANAVVITTVTATLTETKPVPTTTTVMKNNFVTLSPELSTTTVTKYKDHATAVTPVPTPFTEPVPTTAMVKETPTVTMVSAEEETAMVKDHEPVTTIINIERTPEKVIVERVKVEENEFDRAKTPVITAEHSITSSASPTPTLIVETPETTTVSTTSQTITISPRDPSEPTVTIQSMLPVSIEDVESNLRGQDETQVYVGETEAKSGTMTKVVSHERGSCDSSTGMLGVVNKQLFCVNEFIDWSNYLKRLRMEGSEPPENATQMEKDYVRGQIDIPFKVAAEHAIFAHPDDNPRNEIATLRNRLQRSKRIIEYYRNNQETRSLEEMKQIDPEVFNSMVFFRIMEWSTLKPISASWWPTVLTPLSTEQHAWQTYWENNPNQPAVKVGIQNGQRRPQATDPSLYDRKVNVPNVAPPKVHLPRENKQPVYDYAYSGNYERKMVK